MASLIFLKQVISRDKVFYVDHLWLKLSGCIRFEHRKTFLQNLFRFDSTKKAVDPFLSTVVHAAPLERHHQIMKTN
jgi:hypothetical protein